MNVWCLTLDARINVLLQQDSIPYGGRVFSNPVTHTHMRAGMCTQPHTHTHACAHVVRACTHICTVHGKILAGENFGKPTDKKLLARKNLADKLKSVLIPVLSVNIGVEIFGE